MTKVITPNHTVREGHSALPGDDARATILCQVCVSLIAHIKPILHVQTQQKVHHLGTATSSAWYGDVSTYSFLECEHAPILCSQLHLHKLHCIHYHSLLIKAVLAIHLCSGIHLSDGLCLVPHINNLRTGFFNVSATQFQFNTQFSLRVRIVLLKLTWRRIKRFRRSYNLVLLIPEEAKRPAVIANSFFWDEK